MKVKSSHIYNLCFIILGVILGVLFCNWSYFEIDKKLSLDSLFGLSITSLIGIYIAKTIQNQQSASRNEKDFFISEIKEAKKHFDKLSYFVDNNVFPFSDTKIIFKELNQNIGLVNTLIKESQSCKNVDFSAVSIDIRNLRRYITSKSPDTNLNIILSQSEKIWVEREIINAKKDLYRLLLKINS